MAKQRILDTGNTIALQYPQSSVPRNTFNLSHPNKLSGNFGNLYPALMQECVPGDTFHCNAQFMARLQAMLAPVYQHMRLRVDFFNVDNILVWPNFYKFISPLQVGDIAPAMPFLTGTFADKSLGDYLGIPSKNLDGTAATVKVSALPFAAYQKTICDWYSDTDLQNGGKDSNWSLPLVDGDNSANLAVLNALGTRNADRGYLTSAKPWAQKGNPVVLPLTSTNLPVTVIDNTVHGNVNKVGGAVGTPGTLQGVTSGGVTEFADGGGQPAYYAPNGSLGISAASALTFAGTINDLRSAEALQAFLEAELYGGNRYQEYVSTMFGVETDDRRMFRARYLDSFSTDISISEVLNTTGTATAPQGAMAGHGFAAKKHPEGVHFTAKEHGWFIGIVSVIPVQQAWYQCLRPEFIRFGRFDYLTPMLAELGAQAIINDEVGVTAGTGHAATFGYVPRYTDYRMTNGKVCGDFRTNQDFWHLDAKLTSLPTLSGAFLQFISAPGTVYRNFAVIDPSTDHILLYCYFDMKVERALPRVVRPR